MYQQINLFDIESDERKYVRRISFGEARPFIENIHYSRKMPTVTDAFGLFVDGIMVGVVTYGIPASRAPCVGIAGEENADHVLELNRLVIHPKYAQKNYASYLVSHSLKMLPSGTFVISYADTAWTHIGYVYQACNFLYTGLSAKHIDAFHPEGAHPRHVDRGKYGSVYCERSRKHRYVYLVGNRRTKERMLRELKYEIIHDYPKGDEVRYDTDRPVMPTQMKLIHKKGRKRNAQ